MNYVEDICSCMYTYGRDGRCDISCQNICWQITISCLKYFSAKLFLGNIWWQNILNYVEDICIYGRDGRCDVKALTADLQSQALPKVSSVFFVYKKNTGTSVFLFIEKNWNCWVIHLRLQ